MTCQLNKFEENTEEDNEYTPYMLLRREEYKNKGDELLKQSEKMLKKHFKKDKYKCAIELYIQAAKQYKKSKDKESMANAYIKAEIAKNNVKIIY